MSNRRPRIWVQCIGMIISLALTLIIVLQNSKDDASSAFSGAKSEMAKQKQRGAEKVINQITTVLSIVFFVVAIVVVILPKL